MLLGRRRREACEAAASNRARSTCRPPPRPPHLLEQRRLADRLPLHGPQSGAQLTQDEHHRQSASGQHERQQRARLGLAAISGGAGPPTSHAAPLKQAASRSSPIHGPHLPSASLTPGPAWSAHRGSRAASDRAGARRTQETPAAAPALLPGCGTRWRRPAGRGRAGEGCISCGRMKETCAAGCGCGGQRACVQLARASEMPGPLNGLGASSEAPQMPCRPAMMSSGSVKPSMVVLRCREWAVSRRRRRR